MKSFIRFLSAATVIIIFSSFSIASAQESSQEKPSWLDLKFPFSAGYTFKVDQGYKSQPTHNGRDKYSIDFNLNNTSGNGDYGIPVLAAADGIVRLTPTGYISNYGNSVEIDHIDPVTGEKNFYTKYAHLAANELDQNFKLNVKTGDFVKQGQVIGYLGKTGTDLAHIHFALYKRDGNDYETVNPEPISDILNITESKTYTSNNIMLSSPEEPLVISNGNNGNSYDLFPPVTHQYMTPKQTTGVWDKKESTGTVRIASSDVQKLQNAGIKVNMVSKSGSMSDNAKNIVWEEVKSDTSNKIAGIVRSDAAKLSSTNLKNALESIIPGSDMKEGKALQEFLATNMYVPLEAFADVMGAPFDIESMVSVMQQIAAKASKDIAAKQTNSEFMNSGISVVGAIGGAFGGSGVTNTVNLVGGAVNQLQNSNDVGSIVGSIFSNLDGIDTVAVNGKNEKISSDGLATKVFVFLAAIILLALILFLTLDKEASEIVRKILTTGAIGAALGRFMEYLPASTRTWFENLKVNSLSADEIVGKLRSEFAGPASGLFHYPEDAANSVKILGEVAQSLEDPNMKHLSGINNFDGNLKDLKNALGIKLSPQYKGFLHGEYIDPVTGEIVAYGTGIESDVASTTLLAQAGISDISPSTVTRPAFTLKDKVAAQVNHYMSQYIVVGVEPRIARGVVGGNGENVSSFGQKYIAADGKVYEDLTMAWNITSEYMKAGKKPVVISLGNSVEVREGMDDRISLNMLPEKKNDAYVAFGNSETGKLYATAGMSDIGIELSRSGSVATGGGSAGGQWDLQTYTGKPFVMGTDGAWTSTGEYSAGGGSVSVEYWGSRMMGLDGGNNPVFEINGAMSGGIDTGVMGVQSALRTEPAKKMNEIIDRKDLGAYDVLKAGWESGFTCVADGNTINVWNGDVGTNIEDIMKVTFARKIQDFISLGMDGFNAKEATKISDSYDMDPKAMIMNSTRFNNASITVFKSPEIPEDILEMAKTPEGRGYLQAAASKVTFQSGWYGSGGVNASPVAGFSSYLEALHDQLQRDAVQRRYDSAVAQMAVWQQKIKDLAVSWTAGYQGIMNTLEKSMGVNNGNAGVISIPGYGYVVGGNIVFESKEDALQYFNWGKYMESSELSALKAKSKSLDGLMNLYSGYGYPDLGEMQEYMNDAEVIVGNMRDGIPLEQKIVACETAKEECDEYLGSVESGLSKLQNLGQSICTVDAYGKDNAAFYDSVPSSVKSISGWKDLYAKLRYDSWTAKWYGEGGLVMSGSITAAILAQKDLLARIEAQRKAEEEAKRIAAEAKAKAEEEARNKAALDARYMAAIQKINEKVSLSVQQGKIVRINAFGWIWRDGVTIDCNETEARTQAFYDIYGGTNGRVGLWNQTELEKKIRTLSIDMVEKIAEGQSIEGSTGWLVTDATPPPGVKAIPDYQRYLNMGVIRSTNWWNAGYYTVGSGSEAGYGASLELALQDYRNKELERNRVSTLASVNAQIIARLKEGKVVSVGGKYIAPNGIAYNSQDEARNMAYLMNLQKQKNGVDYAWAAGQFAGVDSVLGRNATPQELHAYSTSLWVLDSGPSALLQEYKRYGYPIEEILNGVRWDQINPAKGEKLGGYKKNPSGPIYTRLEDIVAEYKMPITANGKVVEGTKIVTWITGAYNDFIRGIENMINEALRAYGVVADPLGRGYIAADGRLYATLDQAKSKTQFYRAYSQSISPYTLVGNIPSQVQFGVWAV